MTFYILVVIDDKTFEGMGSSKKHAKNEAARAALRNVFGIELPASGTPVITRSDAKKVPDCEFGDFIAR